MIRLEEDFIVEVSKVDILQEGSAVEDAINVLSI